MGIKIFSILFAKYLNLECKEDIYCIEKKFLHIPPKLTTDLPIFYSNTLIWKQDLIKLTMNANIRVAISEYDTALFVIARALLDSLTGRV